MNSPGNGLHYIMGLQRLGSEFSWKWIALYHGFVETGI